VSKDPAAELTIRYSHPAWIIDAFASALGDLREVTDLLEADNMPARVVLAARDPAVRAELLASGGIPADRSPFGVVWQGALDIEWLGTPALGVQDEGSQLVTLALLDAPTAHDRRWLDLCAGPGGKAALMSAVAAQRDPAITITANEISEHRARLVRDVVGSNTTVVVADGTEVEGAFDRILIDAPCSGIGALRRRPEARWRRKAADVGNLRPIQRDLLRHGLGLLAPGGVLAYVTCSPHPAETVQMVESVLKGMDEVEVIDATPFLHGVENAARGPFTQLWPHRHGTDGMFLALLRRADR
jgi:16S rRNA (cytosine967-C5)-methyltransferase